MSCLDVMYHQGCGAHLRPAAYKAAYYGHHQRKPSAYSKGQECLEQQMHPQQHHHHHQHHQHLHQQQLQQGRAAGMLPRDEGLRRASLPPGSRCSVSSLASGGGGDGDSQEDCVLAKGVRGEPAGATEYLGARCVLFSYFQGSVGDVVDQHFSRALSQAFAREPKPALRVAQPPPPSPPLPGALWKDGAALSEGPFMNMWTSGTYPSPVGPCLPPTSPSSSSSTSPPSSSSLSIPPDFPCTVSPLPFLPTDGALWPGHALAPDPHSPWSYGLGAGPAGAPALGGGGGGVPGGYPQLHDLYPHHPASVHAHHPHPHHPHGHPYPHHAGRFPHAHPLHAFASHAAAGAMDPRFAPLLLPGVRQRTSCAEAQGSPPPPPPPPLLPRPLSDGVKTEMDAGVPTATASTLAASWSPASLGGSLEVYDSGLNQEKTKSWF